MPALRVVAALLLLLLLVAACLLRRWAAGGARAGPPGAAGGAAAAGETAPGETAPGETAPGGTAADGTAPSYCLGEALERISLEFDVRDRIGPHPLDRDGYSAPAAVGGAAPAGGAPAWTSYSSWGALNEDPRAKRAYLAERARVLGQAALDWGPVLRELGPRLAEDREYIGLVNWDSATGALSLARCEASPINVGAAPSAARPHASVPDTLVRAYEDSPAMFLVHTHPSSHGCDPLPSEYDLASSVRLAALGRFAASVVISRYGVFIYGLDWDTYKAINQASNWNLAVLNLMFHVASAQEGSRGWATGHRLSDRLALYERHGLYLAVHPSPEMVRDRRVRYACDLDTPVDRRLLRLLDVAIRKSENSVALS